MIVSKLKNNYFSFILQPSFIGVLKSEIIKEIESMVTIEYQMRQSLCFHNFY